MPIQSSFSFTFCFFLYRGSHLILLFLSHKFPPQSNKYNETDNSCRIARPVKSEPTPSFVEIFLIQFDEDVIHCVFLEIASAATCMTQLIMAVACAFCPKSIFPVILPLIKMFIFCKTSKFCLQSPVKEFLIEASKTFLRKVLIPLRFTPVLVLVFTSHW